MSRPLLALLLLLLPAAAASAAPTAASSAGHGVERVVVGAAHPVLRLAHHGRDVVSRIHLRPATTGAASTPVTVAVAFALGLVAVVTTLVGARTRAVRVSPGIRAPPARRQ